MIILNALITSMMNELRINLTTVETSDWRLIKGGGKLVNRLGLLKELL